MKRTAIGEYEKWLPDELVYSVTKEGGDYASKVKRARRPIEDRRSMYGYLGTEWFNHVLFRRQGKQHADTHEMSAQLQLAKLGAGFFDKAGLAAWLLLMHHDPTANDVRVAEEMGYQINRIKPWRDKDADFDAMLELPFEETPFAPAIEGIMGGIMLAADNKNEIGVEAAAQVYTASLAAGGLAVACYQRYATLFLEENELWLPPSQHEPV